MCSFVYRVLPGIFAQAETCSDQSTFDFLRDNFGLISNGNQPPSHTSTGAPFSGHSGWQTLAKRIEELNLEAPVGVSYKVVFLARHGIGWHNVAETKYGTDDWNDQYSKLDGADGLHWVDARLTPEGEEQAKSVAAHWARQHRSLGMPVPESFYCSPLIRCLQTARTTHAGPEWGPDGSNRYRPVIKEKLRETYGVHTCDRRSPKRAIQVRFPECVFEDGFSELDLLWSAEERETPEQQDLRLRECLDEIFATDNNTWISVTAHSGTSRAIMKILEFPREWRLKPGEMVPIAVEAQRDVVGNRAAK